MHRPLSKALLVTLVLLNTAQTLLKSEPKDSNQSGKTAFQDKGNERACLENMAKEDKLTYVLPKQTKR